MNNATMNPLDQVKIHDTPQPQTTSIHAVISHVTAAIGSVGKNDTNEFHRFKYRSYADLVDRISPAMTQHGLVIYQSDQTCDYATYTDAKSRITTRCTMRTVFTAASHHCPGDTITIVVNSLGDDSGDKATSKAQTMAMKSLYQTLFHVAYSDIADPDGITTDTGNAITNDIVAKAHRIADKSRKPGADITKLAGALAGLSTVHAAAMDAQVTTVPWWAPGTEPATGTLGNYINRLIDVIQDREER